MPIKPTVYTSSGAVSAGGITIDKLEVCPDGGSVDVRFIQGTDSSGTKKYRIKAQEKSEFRDFDEGLQIDGPVYLDFYQGAGAVTIMEKS
uniref:Uncharacterized protein n=1 Tax=viral metagenome TaxID=1070528 RepID=A0A6M3L8W2_9ZZZZ